MLGGIIFQTGELSLVSRVRPRTEVRVWPAVILVFALFCLEYFIRYFKGRPIRSIGSSKTTATDTNRGEFTKKLGMMVLALAFITQVLFIR
jgi:hypothetical protein